MRFSGRSVAPRTTTKSAFSPPPLPRAAPAVPQRRCHVSQNLARAGPVDRLHSARGKYQPASNVRAVGCARYRTVVRKGSADGFCCFSFIFETSSFSKWGTSTRSGAGGFGFVRVLVTSSIFRMKMLKGNNVKTLLTFS